MMCWKLSSRAAAAIDIETIIFSLSLSFCVGTLRIYCTFVVCERLCILYCLVLLWLVSTWICTSFEFMDKMQKGKMWICLHFLVAFMVICKINFYVRMGVCLCGLENEIMDVCYDYCAFCVSLHLKRCKTPEI